MKKSLSLLIVVLIVLFTIVILICSYLFLLDLLLDFIKNNEVFKIELFEYFAAIGILTIFMRLAQIYLQDFIDTLRKRFKI